MRKAKKEQAENFILLLQQAHDEIRKAFEKKGISDVLTLLADCQDGAIALGTMIEQSEGEGGSTITLLEGYCELTYLIHESIVKEENVSANSIYEGLNNQLAKISDSVKCDIKVRKEVVFLPYKASMWDSLESIWMAADADPDCDAYVVPIPYYEKSPEGALDIYHYEGDSFPEYVPVTYYADYSVEQREPDVVYIHNPYDDRNYVTSVAPQYYSWELKKHTNLLVYVPYYITSGGVSDGQTYCPAYENADYIILQVEKHKQFIHPAIPREKLLVLGSPKADKVIRLCENPPKPPADWIPKMAGKKVYFYNTSLNGMLWNTRKFLLKMEYVFKCFEGREDACLLWRPHPLMESTLDSMRKEFRPEFDRLKKYFIEHDLGIYDETPDIEYTIAQCDAYIGDSASSVTALFGIAGKPLFILNNNIHTPPEEEDWRGEIIRGFSIGGSDKWVITQGNKLYYSPENDFHYQWCCDLSEYATGNYYIKAIEVGDTVYICPGSAQDIVVLKGCKIIRRIRLQNRTESTNAFYDAWQTGDYLFLIPFRYPAIVRYDIRRNRVDYLEGYNDFFVQNVQGEWRFGGSRIWENFLMIASPTENKVLAIDVETMKPQLLKIRSKSRCGCCGMMPDGDEIWMLPIAGKTVVRWNPKTGAVREYSDMPEGLYCVNRGTEFICDNYPFSYGAFLGNKFILPPSWGNIFVSVDMETGKAEEWKAPFSIAQAEKNDYFSFVGISYFMYQTDTLGENTYRFFYVPERKLYDINLDTKKYREVDIVFDKKDLEKHEPGFSEISEWLAYGCNENALNSLSDFLDGKISGGVFSRECQLAAYRKMIVNNDGSCGEKVHQAIVKKL
ncbi:MAG: hypothetical protein HDQ96_02560 [Lachnospiraceae bacterium]|nr:hypothetical protein [Lachnospiraceae bacterium]